MADFQGSTIQLLVIGLASLIMVRTIMRRIKKNPNKPPCPLALPIIGHLHLLAPIPHQSLRNLSLRYGPIFQLFLGSVPCVIASTPETAYELLRTHEASFSNRPQNTSVDLLTYGSQDFSFAPYGPYWKFMKKLCMSELLGGKILDHLLPVRRQETLRFLRILLNKAEKNEVVDVGGELLTLSNNIISRMLMGQTYSEDEGEAEQIRKLVRDTAELTGLFNVSDFIWLFKNWDVQGIKKKAKKIRDRFEDMMNRVIREHQEERMKMKERGEKGYEVKDLLHILLDIYDDETSEVKLSMENIKAFILVSNQNSFNHLSILIGVLLFFLSHILHPSLIQNTFIFDKKAKYSALHVLYIKLS